MTGFRLDISRFRRKAAKLGSDIRAEAFKPELDTFLRDSLKTAAKITPERSLSLIRRNQTKQYRLRINCIPSAHTLVNPSLRVNETMGEHWLYNNGRWLNATKWKLSAPDWNAYQGLLAERQRRMRTARPAFIAGRAQARFLYRKSWFQVANSLGLGLTAPANVDASHSRHNPPKVPPRGYGQWRGGKGVLSALIRNPLLDLPSQYKDFDAASILTQAMAAHRPAYERRLATRLKRMAGVVMRA